MKGRLGLILLTQFRKCEIDDTIGEKKTGPIAVSLGPIGITGRNDDIFLDVPRVEVQRREVLIAFNSLETYQYYDGTLENIHHALYVRCREQIGRAASPTAAIIDSHPSTSSG